MEASGVRYALAPDKSVADPKTALKLERAYRCFDCGEHVHVRRGKVRKPYFAHYAERPHPCNAETIAHEAAKRRLVALLFNARDHAVVSEIFVRPPLFWLHFSVRNSDRALPFVAAKLPQPNRKGPQAP